MKADERDRAIVLRKAGMSLGEISKRLRVSKASASVWVRGVSLTDAQRSGLSLRGRSVDSIEKRRINRLSNERKKRLDIMIGAGKRIATIKEGDLLLIGAVLYWGEGGKAHHGMARVSNSDPAVIKVMMRFFREVCLVPEEKFRGSIHTYSHLNAIDARKYWSEVSGIPENQFYKTYIKPSIASQGKMKDKLPYGTFDVTVCNTKLFLTIMGWIEKIKQLLLGETGPMFVPVPRSSSPN